MNKSYLMKSMALTVMAVTAVSCNHDAWNERPDNTKQEALEYETNFKNMVLGGQAVDASQNWSTATNTKVTVKLNADYGETYKVMIFTTSPINDKTAAYIGQKSVRSGETAVINVSRPTDAKILYAGYYKNGYLFAQPFAVNDNEGSVSFGTAASSAPARRATTGQDYSVPVYNEPTGLAALKEGAVELTEANKNDGSIEKFIVTGNTTVNPDALQWGDGRSLYIAAGATLNITGDFRPANTNKVIVEGTLNITGKVTTCANGDKEANIHVLNGGSITGTGELQFANGTISYNYNDGTIDVGTLNINGGTLYNTARGTITAKVFTGGASNSLLINHGSAHFEVAGNSVSDSWTSTNAGVAIWNACQIIVDKWLNIGGGTVGSRMDAGSYIECASLYFIGDPYNTISRINMGPNSLINIVSKNGVSGDLKIGNFGIWGPASNANGVAYVQFQNMKNAGDNCFYTTGQATTYAANYVQFNYPEGAVNDGDFAAYVAGTGWDGNDNCFEGTGLTHNVTEAHRILDKASVIASDCVGTTIIDDDDDDDDDEPATPSYIYFAFEDLGATDDFDFNDVVVRISTPDENNISTVELCAIGGTLESTVFNGTTQIGSEVHAYGSFGDNTKTVVKTLPVQIGTVTVPAGTTPADLNINIKVKRSNGQLVTVSRPSTGEIPYCVIVTGDENGKWYWPQERVSISSAYNDFGAWGANRESNPDWYKNPTGSVVRW
ncbi:MAG: DUF4842 domain-containing protein [Prevotella sp.]|nr:DUF4842 domain-containing protein [Prevotella sp.]